MARPQRVLTLTTLAALIILACLVSSSEARASMRALRGTGAPSTRGQQPSSRRLQQEHHVNPSAWSSSSMCKDPPLHLYINPDGAITRGKFMKGYLTNISVPHVRVQGVDGHMVARAWPHVFTPGKKWADGNKRPGVAACALSHLKAVLEVYRRGLCWAVIMEDDVVIPFDMDWAGVAASLPEGWEIAQLMFQAMAGKGVWEEWEAYHSTGELWRKWEWPLWGTQAYIINANGARKVVEAVGLDKSRPDSSSSSSGSSSSSSSDESTKRRMAGSRRATEKDMSIEDADGQAASSTASHHAMSEVVLLSDYIPKFHGDPADWLLYTLTASYTSRFPLYFTNTSLFSSMLHANNTVDILDPTLEAFGQVYAQPKEQWPSFIRGVIRFTCNYMDCARFFPHTKFDRGEHKKRDV